MYHLKQIPSSAQIRKYLRRIVFGKNLFCPVCRSPKIVSYESRYRCRSCRSKFSLLSHTWLGNMKVGLQKFWLILWCWTKQIPVKQTMALTSLSEKGIRHWYDLFRQHLPRNQEVLEHIIQLDEAYFGGWTGFALMAGKQAGTRKLAYQILNHNQPSRTDALNFLNTFVKPKSQLNTDGSTIYQGINRYFAVSHRFENHKEFKFTNTAEIEGLFGVLRTFIRRMYHHVTAEKFPEIMCEFYFRFSNPKMFENPLNYLKTTLRLVPTG